MSRALPLLFPAMLLVFAAACTGTDNPVVVPDPMPEPPADPRIDGCDDSMLVALVQGGDCWANQDPRVLNGWDIYPLFLGPESEQTQLDQEMFGSLPADMQWFCVYEQIDPSAPPPSNLDAHPDCGAVAALVDADEVTTNLFDPIQSTFATEIETEAAVPGASEPTWVAVVDTATDSPVGPGFDPVDQAFHGCTVGAIVQQVACGDAPADHPACGAQVGSYLALDRIPATAAGGTPPRDPVNGGFFGSQQNLAKRIWHAVRDHDLSGTDANLVINLSVGWEGIYNQPLGSPSGTVHNSVTAVRKAIELAACEGALVIAAAGNQGGGPSQTSGPMYPAAWADQEIPASCPTTVGTASYAPIVHAIAAVDNQDRPVIRSRVGGQPRLVAPGFHAMADTPRFAPSCGINGLPVSSMTGSSISTAVASGTAAAVWRIHPDLAAADVMQLLYDSSVFLDPDPSGSAVVADFGPTGASVGRISACRAMELACDVAMASGPTPAGCPTSCAPRPAYDEVDLSWGYDPNVGQNRFDAAPLSLLVAPDCGSGVCPHEAFDNGFAAPWAVEPQPGTDPCAECWIVKLAVGGELYMAINPEFSATLYDGKIVFVDENMVKTHTVDLAAAISSTGAKLGDGLAPGVVVKVPDLALPDPQPVRGRLEFRITKNGVNRSVTSEVAVFNAP